MKDSKSNNKEILAYNFIKDKILSLEYEPGQPLRETELSNEMGMSRTPIRVALTSLTADGFVEELGARTNIVSRVTADSFIQIYQIREALEMLCASVAPYRWNDEKELEDLKNVLSEMTQMSREPAVNSHKFLSADREFHAMLAKMTRNDLLVNEMMNIYDLYWRYNYYSLFYNRANRIVQEHNQILIAVSQRDVALAKEAMHNHLSPAKDDIMIGLANGFNPIDELYKAVNGYVLRK